MAEAPNSRKKFIEQAESLVLENASDENFGVSELAARMNMSRSSLLRKIKNETALSASQFIRKLRLKKAMDVLQESSLTVSEVSYQVGFGSVSYFIKCFREEYGFPPGEVGKIAVPAEEEPLEEAPKKSRKWLIVALVLIIGVMASLVFYPRSSYAEKALEKSIAVLPFKNESSDSSNLYFVNGLMESTLSNLQKIKDLRVISRTSAEKYRNSGKSILEIAKELNVNYLVEGSGQKVGDKVMLNIQLIDASADRQVWTQQYKREVDDIFEIQNDVANEIANAISAFVRPVERHLIEKRPTQSIEAYDLYLQALDPYYTRTQEGLEEAISLFNQALVYDDQFALAYAHTAIAYYFLDLFQQDKQYLEELNRYADKALLYDSKSDISLIAKGLYYLQNKEYRLALPHLEKALEYNPNSSSAIQMLSDFYAFRVPNTAKYLQYALKGIQLEVMAKDSISTSYSYLQLSNALVQAGFFKEAYDFVNRSLAYYPENYYAPHLKIFIRFAQDGNWLRTQNLLEKEWQKDSSRLDILQDLAKVYYAQEKWDSAYFYFKKLVTARDSQNLKLYEHEDAKIAFVYRKLGKLEEAMRFVQSYSDYCAQDESIYKSANLAVKYAYLQKNDLALKALEEFSEQRNFQYWFLLIENDPLMGSLQNLEEYQNLMQKIRLRFWEDHASLRTVLEERGLL
jgi:TolB-like protein/AraC-like DNA-binding protein